MVDLQAIKAACGRISCGLELGTGYLISPTQMVTCAHVVKSADDAKIHIDGQDVAGKVVKRDDLSDSALLELTPPVTVPPLRLAAASTIAQWSSYGFPGIAEGIGLPLEGSVLDPKGIDVNQRPAIVLYSDQVSAGMAVPVGGYSGSPVLSGGVVVGHLKRVLSERDKPGRPVLGLLFATPAADILSSLGLPSPTAAPQVAAPAPSASSQVLLSYAPQVAAWAQALADNLATRAVSVTLDQTGLADSKSAIALVTKDWLDSPASALLKRAVVDNSFHLVPILLEDVQLPGFWGGRIQLDFRRQPVPTGLTLDRVVLALSGQAQPASDAEKAVQRLLNEIDAAAITADRVYSLWTQLNRTSVLDPRVSIRSAERLISLGRPDYALEVIGNAGGGARAGQLKGLALAKTGRIEDAIQVLQLLETESPTLDPETGGILAGRYRQMWQRTKKLGHLERARATYKRYFEATGSTYCGINAASTALDLGDTQDAAHIARQLIEQLKTKPESALDHWEISTLGHAYLITGDLPKARELYLRAAGQSASFYQDISVMRRGVRRTCKALNLPQNSLDDILDVPRVAAFFGHSIDGPNRPEPRFPPRQVGTVRKDIRAKLDELRVGYGFSSATTGGDLLFLEELIERGGQAVIVLPCPVEDFAPTFLFGSWTDRFEKVRKAASRIIVVQRRPNEDVWDTCRRTIREEVCEQAKVLDEPANLIVLWDGQTNNYVSRAVDDWSEDADAPIHEIKLEQAKAAAT